MADVLAIDERYRAQSRGMLIRECRASGLSNREFCKQRGVPEKSDYYWLRKLRQLAVEAMPELVPLKPVPKTSEKLEITFKGAKLSVPVSVDMDAVAALLRSLQRL